MEQLHYNLMFRWFVGLSVDEPVWNPSSFPKNRDRLAQADVGRRLFEAIVEMARRRNLSADGTLIAAWASQKRVRRKDGSDDDNPDGVGRNAGRNFHGEKRSNTTHASRTDPEAMLATNADLTLATGTAERDAAIEMAIGLNAGATLGADKGCDRRDFVEQLRDLEITPHVAQNIKRRGGSAIDGRTTRHPGYAITDWPSKHRSPSAIR